MSVLGASVIGSFGCTNKDLIMLVSLKRTLTLYFAKVCLYYSLRSLMYGMTVQSYHTVQMQEGSDIIPSILC